MTVKYEDLKDFRECGGMMVRKDASATDPSPVLSAIDVYRICAEKIGQIRQEIADVIPSQFLHMDNLEAVKHMAEFCKIESDLVMFYMEELEKK